MKTRKFYRLFLLLLFTIICPIAFCGNGIIKGIAYEQKTFEILKKTTVILYKNRSFEDIAGCDVEGVFTLEDLDTGWYFVVIKCLNFETKIFDSIRIDSNTIYLIYPELRNISGFYLNNYSRAETPSRRFTQPSYTDLYNPFSGLKVYPNPVQDILSIDRQNATVLEVKIFDMNGNIYEVFKLTDKFQSLSLQHLPKGMYTIKFVALDDQKDFRFLKL